MTPLGVADWLLEMILVSIASVYGAKKETRIVTVIASAAVLAGLWSSPPMLTPFWMGALNRVVAIITMWTMALIAGSAAQNHLHGLLPICAGCKSIRGAGGEWHKLETYLSAKAGARWTHGLCPPCAAKYMDTIPEHPLANSTNSAG